MVVREEEEFYTFFELALLHHDEGEHHSEEASVSLIVAGPSWRGNVCVCVCVKTICHQSKVPLSCDARQTSKQPCGCTVVD